MFIILTLHVLYVYREKAELNSERTNAKVVELNEQLVRCLLLVKHYAVIIQITL